MKRVLNRIENKLTGNTSKLTGDATDLWGSVTNLRGDVDMVGITPEERAKGIDIKSLVKRQKKKVEKVLRGAEK